ncbi:GAF domain-containing sensor histidine kinase [Thermosulfurimonas dismutans]|uniref:histidine kinase n=1 Tax=Thermosulfurimonas dismutans TaxID=999894 RepID=A0A179D2L8_9BACT|nr:GAF domain-containing sensor histidine kinase [Thermosulfurimonas dismutans]OAQ20324.1 sensory transduction histidine kinase [Thermosulfurimonas dismutans]
MKPNNSLRIFIETFEDLLEEIESSPGIFYAHICELMKKLTGADLVWLGFLEPSGEVHPIGFAGKYPSYLKGLKINIYDPNLSQGPTGQAILKKTTIIEPHIHLSKSFAPWRDRALHFGFRSSAAIPLTTKDKVFGTLNFYSTKEDFFSQENLDLLKPHVALVSLALRVFEVVKNKEKTIKILEKKIYLSKDQIHKKDLEIQSLKENQTRWLANLGHEFRTPLTSILGFSEMLLSEIFGPLNEKQKRYLQHIKTSTQYLAELIEEIQKFARLDRSRKSYSPEIFNLGELIDGVVFLLYKKIVSHNALIVKDFSDDLKIKGDSFKTKMVLFNLISNALKFIPPGGTIVLKSRLEKDLYGRSWMAFEVRDNGPGVKPEDLYRIFLPWIQGGKLLTEKPEGLGLGLALSKELIEAQGGNIMALSPPEGGGFFIFFLPQEAHPEKKTLEMLVFEPRFEVARKMALYLTSEGVKSTIFPEVEPALKILKTQKKNWALAFDPWHLGSEAFKVLKKLDQEGIIIPLLVYRASDRGELYWIFGANFACLDRPSFLSLERAKKCYLSLFPILPSKIFLKARPHLFEEIKRLISSLNLEIYTDLKENYELSVIDLGLSPEELQNISGKISPSSPLVISFTDPYLHRELGSGTLNGETFSREIQRLVLNFEPEISRTSPLT